MHGTKRLINHCFSEQVLHCKGNEVKFSYTELESFWKNHQPGQLYELKNRNGTSEICKIAYFPLNCTYLHDEEKGEKVLKYHNDLYALIEIKIKDGTDLREVPVRFIKLKT